MAVLLSACGTLAGGRVDSGEIVVPEMSSEDLLVSSLELLLEEEEVPKEARDLTEAEQELHQGAEEQAEEQVEEEADKDEQERVPAENEAVIFYGNAGSYDLNREIVPIGEKTAEELVDASEGKESLKGSIQAKLQKKLVVNTASVLFDLLGQVGSGEAVGQAGAYLSSALYQLFRQLYRSAGGNEGYFSTDSRLFDMDVLAADMTLARIRYANALEAYQGEYPAVDDQSLAESYQGLAQAVAQVFHNTDERVRGLGISDAQQG